MLVAFREHRAGVGRDGKMCTMVSNSDRDEATAETLLYRVDPEDDGLLLLPASAIDDLVAEAKAVAFLWEATWSQIRWGRGQLSSDVREWVDAKLEMELDAAWEELHSDDPDSPERPAEWLPADAEYPDPPFGSGWRECQRCPMNSHNGIPAEIARLGQGPGRPGAEDLRFFQADQLEDIRVIAESLGMALVHDDVAVMRCWAEVWAEMHPDADRYVDEAWREFMEALAQHR